jgi:hypothetical protein
MIDAGGLEVGLQIYSATRLGPGGDWPLGGTLCRVDRREVVVDDTGELEAIEVLWVRHSSAPLERIRMTPDEINPATVKRDGRAVQLLIRTLGEQIRRKSPGSSQRFSDRELQALEDVCYLVSRGAV